MMLRGSEIKNFSARFSLVRFFALPFLLLLSITTIVLVAIWVGGGLFDPVYIVAVFIIFLVVFKERISLASLDETRMRFTSRQRVFFQYKSEKIYFFNDVISFDSIERLSIKNGYIFKSIVIYLVGGEEKSISGYDLKFSFG